MKELRIAISFLTRLPFTYKGEWDEKSFSRSTIYYPVVGLIIGLLVALAALLFNLTGSPMLAAAAAIITAVVVSGGIHYDGFMDMCDGIFASRGRERALEIMKDSRVGSFAVLGIALLLLLKFALYTTILGLNCFFVIIIAAFIFSRTIMNCAILWFPVVRKEGLGYTVKQYVSRGAPLWGGVLLLLLFIISGNYILLLALILAFVLMMAIAFLICRYLKGMTGDIYGALAELGEAAFLLMTVIAAAVFSAMGLPLELW